MATSSSRSTGSLQKHEEPGRGWQIAVGVLLIVGGFVAVLMPAVAALATVLVLAWVLVISGGFEIVYAFLTRAREGFVWKLIGALLTFILGVAVLANPLAGIATLAVVVACFLFLSGVSRLILAWRLRLRPRRGWGWILFDGVLSIALAIIMAVGWPPNSLAIIGLLTGFALISSGVWRIVLAPRAAA